jgi:hypothetical protein
MKSFQLSQVAQACLSFWLSYLLASLDASIRLVDILISTVYVILKNVHTFMILSVH